MTWMSRTVAEKLNMDNETVSQTVTKKLNMRKVRDKIMPKNLSEEKQLKRKEMYFVILQYMEEDPDFLTSVLTCNETYLFQHNPETELQSMQLISLHSQDKETKNVRIQTQDNACHLLYC